MNSPPVHVYVVDDHRMVATALARALERTGGLVVDGVLASVAEVDARVTGAEGEIDPAAVWVIDYELGEGTAIDVTRILTDVGLQARTVLISDQDAPGQLPAALAAGCLALLSKSRPLRDLVRAIEDAARGNATFDSHDLGNAVRTTAANVERKASGRELSGRELEVLKLLATGAGTGIIASDLHLSVHTVRNHVRNVVGKLGAHSRLEAVSVAARRGLVTLPVG